MVAWEPLRASVCGGMGAHASGVVGQLGLQKGCMPASPL